LLLLLLLLMMMSGGEVTLYGHRWLVDDAQSESFTLKHHFTGLLGCDTV